MCPEEDKVGHPLCIIYCVAHKLELAVLDAVKRCPYLPTFEDTVKEGYKFYYILQNDEERLPISSMKMRSITAVCRRRGGWQAATALLLPWRSTMSLLSCTCSIKLDPLVKMGHVLREF